MTRDRDRGAGPNQGVWRLEQGGVEGWYLLQTNYDHWGPTAPTDRRREVAERAMNATGPKLFNASSMWTVISDTHCDPNQGERPVYNNITVFSEIMEPADPAGLRIEIRGPWPGPLSPAD